jgi:hypothetical protein
LRELTAYSKAFPFVACISTSLNLAKKSSTDVALTLSSLYSIGKSFWEQAEKQHKHTTISRIILFIIVISPFVYEIPMARFNLIIAQEQEKVNALCRKGGSVWSRLGDLRDRVRVWSRTDTCR